MWERLAEIAIFTKDKQYRAPGDILRAFMNIDTNKNMNKLLTSAELTRLRLAFGFLADSYRHIPKLADTKLATDQPQFYTLITTLLSTDLLDKFATSYEELEKRIYAVAQMIEKTDSIPDSLKHVIGKYKAASTKQTTNPGQRSIRHKMLLRALNEVQV